MAEGSVLIPGPVRCAIYTRKSSEEGLQQEFNSLHAQREAAEAFVASQRHQGWLAAPHKYDDGGFTGGNMERPALRKLLADIEAGRIDSVVVYKVDRLSRSLLDFARLMALFEKHGVTFVSVTQQFNTSTPVGRLTLHILLSFAHFERDLISERTRDKKAASKRKGKWTGGYVPLGYDLDGRGGKLLVNEQEAEQVRAIFALFIETRSVEHTLAELQKRGWKSKSWVTEKQRRHEGGPFTDRSLRKLLSNALYAGLVSYRGQNYRGEQRRIVEPKVWRRVQTLLRLCGGQRKSKPRNKHGALLSGLLHCGACGRPMSHTSTQTRTRLYRYYLCRTRACVRHSLAAQAFEDSVVAQLRTAAPESSGDVVTALAARVERITYGPAEGQVSIRLRRTKEKRRG